MKLILPLLLILCLPLMGDDAAKKKFEETKANAEKGLAGAQGNLGAMYFNGEGVQKDFKEAVKWFRKAAEQGDADAQFALGFVYANGIGVPEDDKEAVKWYRKAAEQGGVYAQVYLGYMYVNGEGVPEDLVTAYAWYNIAAANGSKIAKGNKPKIAKDMTPEQIAKGEALAKEMIKKNPKLIND